MSRRTCLLALLAVFLANSCASGRAQTPGGVDAGEVDANPGVPDAAVDAAPGDPCSSQPCFSGVACTPVGNSYQCGDCPAGYQGDGEDCTDVDGCDGDPCYPGVVCADLPPPSTGHSCGNCPAGYQGDGENCTEIDGCDGDPCYPGVVCTDLPPPSTGYSCGNCPAGYQGDGENCTEIDGCDGTPCYPGVVCTDLPPPSTGYSCGDCPGGYYGDGETCDLLCEAATEIQCGSSLVASNSGVGSSDLVDNWACANFTLSGPEIVYEFTPSATGLVSVSLAGLSGDLDLLVIEASGAICNPEDDTVCVGYSGHAGNTPEGISFTGEAGTRYYIVVDGWSGATSSFTLQLGASRSHVQLSEIGLGSTDFVEVINLSACPIDIGGMALLHDPSLAEPFEFVFPSGSMVTPSGVFRLVESSGAPFAPNEINYGQSILDILPDVGFTVLCDGSCDQQSCTNVIDYVERDNNLGDGEVPAGPACANFSPGPVDVSSVSGKDALQRVGLAGGQPWLASDWQAGLTSRD